jgi:hypothetical protein
VRSHCKTREERRLMGEQACFTHNLELWQDTGTISRTACKSGTARFCLAIWLCLHLEHWSDYTILLVPALQSKANGSVANYSTALYSSAFKRYTYNYLTPSQSISLISHCREAEPVELRTNEPKLKIPTLCYSSSNMNAPSSNEFKTSSHNVLLTDSIHHRTMFFSQI